MKEFSIGSKIIRLEQVNSTNQFAKELSSYINPIHEGTIIVTFDQLSGKGRHQKTWVSERNKNVCLSMILYPEFLTSSNLFLLSKTISVGIWDYLHNLNIAGVKIKWPNDIMINSNKVAGILIENSWKRNKLQESIIGVGLNVNQTHFPQMSNHPTSMKLVRKIDYDLENVLIEMLKYIEIRYLQLKAGEFQLIDALYHERLLGMKEERKFNSDKKVFSGIIQGVRNDGKLSVLSKENGICDYDLDQICFSYDD